MAGHSPWDEVGPSLDQPFPWCFQGVGTVRRDRCGEKAWPKRLLGLRHLGSEGRATARSVRRARVDEDQWLQGV